MLNTGPEATERPSLPIGLQSLSFETLRNKSLSLPRAFSIGDVLIHPNVFLSPMSGVTDLSFRRFINALSGGRTGLMVSEFISVEGLSRITPKTCREIRFTEAERPFAVQIFGGRAEQMARGAAMVEQAGADVVEINCGCPVPRVVRHGGGAGLLRDLDLLGEIIRKVVKAVTVPVSVKVRTGWDDEHVNVLDSLRIAEGEGAKCFVIHGRTRLQGYRGLADWNRMVEARQKATIPVVGNGDILTVEDALTRLELSGVDGVSVGRGAMHNPWIFGQIADLYEGKPPREPSLEEQREAFHLYLELLEQDLATEKGVLGRLKQMVARLLKPLPGSSEGRAVLLRSKSVNEFMDRTDEFFISRQGSARDFTGLYNLNGRQESHVEQGNDYRR